ncbi:MAG TPA: FAD-dependent oxidoreductase, partial [Rugosimonospora sp.]|nr:FAD-dependent oxidoreductase [Rugosimonospora sp.]
RAIELTPAGADGTRGPGGEAVTESGRRFPFARLALTVGARPRRLDVPGIGARGVVYLRTVDDASALRTRLADARHVAVVGGGFIGLEAAAIARGFGCTVTVIEAADRLMVRSVAPEVSAFYRDAHARRGVAFRLGAGVVAVHGDPVRAVELSDGTLIDVDLVVVGVGIAPRTELAEQLGLACAGGIVVDASARTSNPAVVAAGDCTVTPHPRTGALVRLESVPHAQSQARVAAATLLGAAPPRPTVPWFWSDQYDLKLQIAGLPDGYDETVVRPGPTEDSFAVLYYRAGQLLAVNAINRVADYVAVRRALGGGRTIDPRRAADPDTPLADLIAAVPSAGPGAAPEPAATDAVGA